MYHRFFSLFVSCGFFHDAWQRVLQGSADPTVHKGVAAYSIKRACIWLRLAAPAAAAALADTAKAVNHSWVFLLLIARPSLSSGMSTVGRVCFTLWRCRSMDTMMLRLPYTERVSFIYRPPGHGCAGCFKSFFQFIILLLIPYRK